MTSTLLSYMLVSGIFGRRNLRGLDLSLELPAECYAGAAVPVGIRLTNRRRFLPAFLIRAIVDREEILFPVVGPRSSSLLHLTKVFEKRGKHTLSEVSIASVFPFNFFTRFRRLPGNLDLIVFPRLQPCNFQSLPASRTKWRGEGTSDHSGTDSDLLFIRDYAFGDPLKTINWKATAKTGRLKTKELSTTEAPTIMIDFDRLDRRNLEQALSRTAYLIVRAVHAGTPVGLRIDGNTYEPGCSAAHKTTLLTRLALYGQD